MNKKEKKELRREMYTGVLILLIGFMFFIKGGSLSYNDSTIIPYLWSLTGVAIMMWISILNMDIHVKLAHFQ